jgi:hypothetical protein
MAREILTGTPAPDSTARNGWIDVDADRQTSCDREEAMKIRISPLPAAFLENVRSQGVDALDQPVERVVAEGGEPCRDVLRRARPGEELLLVSHSPFSVEGPFREFGPIYVLASPSAEPVALDRLPVEPPAAGLAPYLRDHFVLRAYSADERIADAAMVGPGEAGDVMARFFGDPEVAFVHARFPLYGCFACRIERG